LVFSPILDGGHVDPLMDLQIGVDFQNGSLVRFDMECVVAVFGGGDEPLPSDAEVVGFLFWVGGNCGPHVVDMPVYALVWSPLKVFRGILLHVQPVS